MLSRECYWLLFLTLAIVLPSSGQQLAADRAAPPLVSRNLQFNTESRALVFELENRGTQEVTAFEYTLTAVNKSGETFIRSETNDLLALFAVRSLGPLSGGPATSFRPRESYRIRWVLPPQWGDIGVESITIETTMVMYEDCGAIGNDRSIDLVFREREVRGQELAEGLNKIKTVARDGSFAAAVRSLASASRKDDSPPSTARVGLLEEVGRAYARSGLAGVDAATTVYQAQADAMTQNCHRKVEVK